jgi:hypothetical protein
MLYGPLIRQALSEWGRNVLYLALDTSMLWGRYCIIRIGLAVADSPERELLDLQT